MVPYIFNEGSSRARSQQASKKKNKNKTNDRHLLWAKYCWSTVGFNEQNSVTNKRDPKIVQKYVKCGVLYRPAFERLFASDRFGKSALQDQQGQNKGVI